MALKFQPLTVSSIIKETSDAVSICFNNPDPTIFKYIPGQYLTLKVAIGAGEKPLNRAYSLSSCPGVDEQLIVTVKVTPGGKVSTWLNEQLKAGDSIDVLPPLGNFTAKIDKGHKKHYLLIGAGSGITPLFSIAQSVLNFEPESRVTLLYGNHDEAHIIFKERLDKLVVENPGRLDVMHTLSQPTGNWVGLTGRINQEKVASLLNKVEDLGNIECFICGPDGMMQTASASLKVLGVPAALVHEEHFSAPLTLPDSGEEKPKTIVESVLQWPMEVKVILENEERTVMVNEGQSILDAALDADMDPPYACMIGSCCTCKAKLLSGNVVMDDREGLTDEEIKEGFVLSCQSHPTTSGVVVSYDEF